NPILSLILEGVCQIFPHLNTQHAETLPRPRGFSCCGFLTSSQERVSSREKYPYQQPAYLMLLIHGEPSPPTVGKMPFEIGRGVYINQGEIIHANNGAKLVLLVVLQTVFKVKFDGPLQFPGSWQI